jgi:ABC-type glycerol-3-phosphate transport system substrate-binding protein
MRFLSLALTAAAALALAGCGGGSNSPPDDDDNEPPPPPPVTTTDFPDFLRDILAQTSDTTDPVDVNDEDFRFPNNDDPDLFDDVVGTP